MMRKRSPVDEGQHSYSTSYNLRGPVYAKFLLPDKVTGSIIGRQGSVLADLEQTTQAQIKISPSRAFFPTTNERMIIVSGEMDQVTAMIPPVIRKLQEHGSDPMRMILRIAIPTSSIPSIIGKGGDIIKSIQSRTGAYIHICDRIDGVPETIVEMKGQDRQIDDCTREILAIIQSDPRIRDVAGQYYGSSGMPPPVFEPQHDYPHDFQGGMATPPPMMDPTANPELLMYPMTIEFVVPALSIPYIEGEEGKMIPRYFRDTGCNIAFSEIAGTQDVNVSISGPLCGVQAAHLLVIKAVTDAILANPLASHPPGPTQQIPPQY